MYKCDYKQCKKTFNTLASRTLHLSRHFRNSRNILRKKKKILSQYSIDTIGKKGRTLALCPFQGCNKSMLSDSIGRHIKTVHLKIRETCSKCNKKFSVAYLSKHIKQCDPLNPIDKSDEEDEIIDVGNGVLPTSIEIHKPSAPLRVNSISRVESIITYKNGQTSDQNLDIDNMHSCCKCKKELNMEEFKTHICLNSTSQYNCRINGCAAVFDDEASRLSHEQAHTKLISCPIKGCQIKLKLINLKKHINTNHKLKPGDCTTKKSSLTASKALLPPPKLVESLPIPVSLESLKMLTSSNIFTNLKPLKISNVTSLAPSISIADPPESPTKKKSVSSNAVIPKLVLNLKTASIAPNILTNSKTIKLPSKPMIIKCFKCNVNGCNEVFETEASKKFHIYKDHIEPMKNSTRKSVKPSTLTKQPICFKEATKPFVVKQLIKSIKKSGEEFSTQFKLSSTSHINEHLAKPIQRSEKKSFKSPAEQQLVKSVKRFKGELFINSKEPIKSSGDKQLIMPIRKSKGKSSICVKKSVESSIRESVKSSTTDKMLQPSRISQGSKDCPEEEILGI